MNKSEIIDNIVQAADISKSAATSALDSVLNSITLALVKGEMVALTGFGTFVVRQSAARKGRNPRTGEELEIKASKRASFKVGKALKDALQKG